MLKKWYKFFNPHIATAGIQINPLRDLEAPERCLSHKDDYIQFGMQSLKSSHKVCYDLIQRYQGGPSLLSFFIKEKPVFETFYILLIRNLFIQRSVALVISQFCERLLIWSCNWYCNLVLHCGPAPLIIKNKIPTKNL